MMEWSRAATAMGEAATRETANVKAGRSHIEFSKLIVYPLARTYAKAKRAYADHLCRLSRDEATPADLRQICTDILLRLEQRSSGMVEGLFSSDH